MLNGQYASTMSRNNTTGQRSALAFGIIGMITGILGLVGTAYGLALQFGAGTQKQAAFEADRRGCLRAIYDFGAATETALDPYDEAQARLDEVFHPVLYACLDTRILDSDSDFVQSWLDLYALTTESPGSLFGSKDARIEAVHELRRHNQAFVDYLKTIEPPSAIQLEPVDPSAPNAEALGFDYSGVCSAVDAAVSGPFEKQNVVTIPASLHRYDRLCAEAELQE